MGEGELEPSGRLEGVYKMYCLGPKAWEAWLQPQTIPELHSVHDERSSTTTDDWKEQAASVQTSSINDLLGDIQVSSTPTPSATSPASTYYVSQQLYLAAAAPFNGVQYGATWPSSSTQHVPVSSYSSLNGATSTSNHAQPQSQLSNSMVIDPALTTMNGTASSPPPQYQQGPFLSSLSSQSQPRMQYSYQQQPHHQPLSINPSYVHSNPSHFQQSQHTHTMTLPRQHSHSPPQQHQQQQGTLSPSLLLHWYPAFIVLRPTPQLGPSSSSSASQSSTPQATSRSTPPSPAPASAPKVSAEQRRAELNRDIKPLIQPTSFTGAGAVSQLVDLLEDYGITEVETPTRLEILTKIRDNAGNHYFRAWVDNSIAMEVVREWLKLAFVGRTDSQLVETIMPILHIIDRLPLNIEKLKASKLGKLIMRLMKDPPTPAIKDMASNLERKWRKLLAAEVSEKMETENPEDPKGKKRRVEGASNKGAPPAKKAAIPSTSSATPKAVAVKKETKPVVKDAKSDSSFFSKPKPTKKEMPSFKKNPSAAVAPVKKEPDPNVAQPSSFNPFEEVLKSYGSASGAPSTTASTSTPPPGLAAISSAIGLSATASPALFAPSALNKAGKPKKSVTWAPEGKLEQIKLIERAIYDDDPATGSHPTHNVRDLDRGEGAALHAHLFDEQIEWAEPQPLEMPPDATPRGSRSQERVAQEERELSALVVLPAEPVSQIPEEQVDEGVCIMLTGPEVDAIFWSGGMPAIIDSLVGQLAAAAGPDAAAAVPNLYPTFSGINPDQLQQLVQHAQALTQGSFNGLGAGGPLSQPQPGDPGQAWGPGNQYSEYDRGYHENGVGRGAGDSGRRWNRGGPRGRGTMGRGGPLRGRGRGDGFRSSKRKPCSFFQAGRCRYGDQCDFSHEQLPY
ncbi:hypothetical protein C8Q74DRAFT_1316733 [Fomes fomentarius]|nr:hypothetical protein C8Q74DRAFT_1316733 [Fomes fomentarius]